MSESDITNCASAGARGLSVTVGGNSQNKRVEKEGWQIAFFAFFFLSQQGPTMQPMVASNFPSASPCLRSAGTTGVGHIPKLCNFV